MAENFVKVAVMGGKVETACLEDEKTVLDAVEAVGMAEDDVDGMDIRINKRPAKLEDAVFNGDIVVFVPKIKAG